MKKGSLTRWPKDKKNGQGWCSTHCHWSIAGCCMEKCQRPKRQFFLSKKSMDKTFGLRSRTVIRSRNWWLGVPIQCPQIWKNQLSSWWTTASLNRVLSGMLSWKEVWSWTKACSKLSRLFFPLDFASLLSRKRWKYTSLQSCVRRKATRIFFYRITAAEAQTHGKLLRWHRRTWCCVWNQRRTLSKKKDELSKLTENSWTCCCLVTEMRSSAQGVLRFYDDGSTQCILEQVVWGMMAYTSFLLWGFHELCVVQRRQHHHFHDQEPSALGTVEGQYLGKKSSKCSSMTVCLVGLQAS